MSKRAKRANPRHVANIVRTWKRATVEERADGLVWYSRAHFAAVAIHEDTGHTLDVVAAVISATSPNNAWGPNLEQSRALCMAVGDEVGAVAVSTYDGGRKAVEILRGLREPRRGRYKDRHTVAFSPRAPKTGAFFSLIMDPGADAVVVDGHAYNIAHGVRIPLDSVPQMTAGRYQAVELAYRKAAQELGVDPAALQATTWLTWRRIHDTASTVKQADPDLSHLDRG